MREDCLDSCKFNPDELSERLKGGIVTKPQITMIGRGDMKAAVIPLDKCRILSNVNSSIFPEVPKLPNGHWVHKDGNWTHLADDDILNERLEMDTIELNTFTGETSEVMDHDKIVTSQTGHLEIKEPMVVNVSDLQEPSKEELMEILKEHNKTHQYTPVTSGKPASESMGVFGQLSGTNIVVKKPIIENIDSTVPKAAYSTPNSAGMDLYTRTEVTIYPSKSLGLVVTKIPLNIKIDPTFTFGPSCYAMLLPRSSTCMKYGIMCANGAGVIDSDYRGEIAMLAYNLTDHTIIIPKGVKIAQLLFMKDIRVNFTEGKVVETGEHLGFGSTGN